MQQFQFREDNRIGATCYSSIQQDQNKCVRGNKRVGGEGNLKAWGCNSVPEWRRKKFGQNSLESPRNVQGHLWIPERGVSSQRSPVSHRKKSALVYLLCSINGQEKCSLSTNRGMDFREQQPDPLFNCVVGSLQGTLLQHYRLKWYFL